VTSVELLAVPCIRQRQLLLEQGSHQLLGLQHDRFLRADPRLPKTGHRNEFKDMVDRLHECRARSHPRRGLQPHREGNELGRRCRFAASTMQSYYRLLPDDPRYYINDTGTGNTLNLSHPRVLQMVTDSLRYWATEMNVDGFRFDLATILAANPRL
jgi:isoamylase